MLAKKLAVNALLPILCRLRFSKCFQSDNHVYYDMNITDSTSDFFPALLKSFLNSETVLVVRPGFH